MTVATSTKPSFGKSADAAKLTGSAGSAKTAVKNKTVNKGSSRISPVSRALSDPRSIAVATFIVACALAAGARLGFGASLLESAFWAASFFGLGLGAASFVRLSSELTGMRQSLEHTRRQMATTARVLAETLEQAENLNRVTEEIAALPPRALREAEASPKEDVSAAEAETHKAHLQGLANVARAQVILANKSEADVNVLSGLIRDLAEAVGEQERELVSLRSEAGEARRLSQEAAKIARQVLTLPRVAVAAPVLAGERKLTAPGVNLVSYDEAPVDRLLISRLETAFVDDGFTVALQPIVTLPQRKVKLYELGLILKGDAPGRSSSMVRKAVLAAGLAANYDRLLIQRALRMIRYFLARQKEITILCEITGAMLTANAAFDLIITELRQEPEIARGLVLGFSHESYSSFRPSEKDLLPFLSEAGVRFAVTGLADMRLDPQALGAVGVRFVTIDVVRLMEAVPTGLAGLDVHVADLSGLFARRKIDLIVQNIISDRDLLDIIDMEIPLAQGKLLGEPRPLNPELSDATAPEPAVASPQPVSVVAPPSPSVGARQPLRNFLRRA